MRALLLALMTTTPAMAEPPEEAARSMTEKLTEDLGVSPESANAIVAILRASKEEGEALRARVREEAQALKTAREAGDARGMKRSMQALQRIGDDLHALQEDTRDDVFDHLTVEQQATWTLFHLKKRVDRHRALEHLRTLKLQQTL